MNGAEPNRSRRGDGCCEPLPQSVGVKKGPGAVSLEAEEKPKQKRNIDYFITLQGQIGYAIVPMIARGIMLGPNKPVILHAADIV
ncbi:malate dehydrogenase [Quercus suber]|uniref:Malate dehydrogenase n=1 Tax=Quercus suber TaxID=58331 RepID=A0AAW0LY02_QUESU